MGLARVTKSGMVGTHYAIEHALEGIQVRLLPLGLRLGLRHLKLTVWCWKCPTAGFQYRW
jgi:hypothetical protein